MSPAHEPPATVTLRFCATCGRRDSALYGHDHYPTRTCSGTIQVLTYDLRAEPQPAKPALKYERVTVADLGVGDAVEWRLIVSNDGWEWVPGVVTAREPFTVRFWDDDVKTLREGASPPNLRRRLEAEPRP